MEKNAQISHNVTHAPCQSEKFPKRHVSEKIGVEDLENDYTDRVKKKVKLNYEEVSDDEFYPIELQSHLDELEMLKRNSLYSVYDQPEFYLRRSNSEATLLQNITIYPTESHIEEDDNII